MSLPLTRTCVNRILLEKLMVTQVVKKFVIFYGTRMLIIVLTAARYLALFWTGWNQSTPTRSTSLRPTLTLFFHLLLLHPRVHFLSWSPTKICIHFSRLLQTCRVPHPSPYMNTIITYNKKQQSLYNFLYSHIRSTSSFLGSHILLGTSFSRNSKSSIKFLKEFKFWSEVANIFFHVTP
jgi:hypothetical protein